MLKQLTAFFMWNTIINAFLLIFSSLLVMSASEWIYDLQSTLFHISKEQFNHLCYLFIGLYKVLLLIFNLIPFLALWIIGKHRDFAASVAKEELKAS